MYMYEDADDLCTYVLSMDVREYPPVPTYCGEPTTDGSEVCDRHSLRCTWQFHTDPDEPTVYCDLQPVIGEELCPQHLGDAAELEKYDRNMDELLETQAASDYDLEEC